MSEFIKTDDSGVCGTFWVKGDLHKKVVDDAFAVIDQLQDELADANDKLYEAQITAQEYKNEVESWKLKASMWAKDATGLKRQIESERQDGLKSRNVTREYHSQIVQGLMDQLEQVTDSGEGRACDHEQIRALSNELFETIGRLNRVEDENKEQLEKLLKQGDTIRDLLTQNSDLRVRNDRQANRLNIINDAFSGKLDWSA